MISPDRIFSNLFDDAEITAARLANFAQDTLNKLTAAGAQTEPYAVLISQITPPLLELQTQLGDVDTSITLQRGATLTNDQVIAGFRETMRTQEGVIANALGGTKSAAFLQFYPHGLMEYTKATKPQISVLVSRVKTAAGTFATQLGEPLATTLQGFADTWQQSRDAQQQQMGTVGNSRTERTAAETDTELALTIAVHTIGAAFPGDVQQCSSFFDFSLLLPQGHRQKGETLTGNVQKNAVTVALNRSFTDTIKLRLTAVSDNASLFVYLGASADAQPNGAGIKVNATKRRNLKLSELGNESDTFLLIKNLSNVNDASYVLEVKD